MSETLKIGFFVTCLVDAMRPSIALASIKLLESAGCDVTVPSAQVCCGQPAFNNGDIDTAKNIARQVIDVFEQYDFLVAPSASCLGMIKVHYPELFQDEPHYLEKVEKLSNKCYEILTFLHDVLKIEISARFDSTVTYHDSCSGLRELGIESQPRQLLNKVKGLKLKEMKDTDICCGFGGTFCVKYPDISTSLVSDKVKNIIDVDAKVVLAGDLGCLMNIAGRCQREGKAVRFYHTVEVLAGMAAEYPAIGEKWS
ncbi:MAG: Fe-S oxidoreductase [Methylophaga sp.]|nr:MAG: Fe-S oxidoreductase [Methylophaga sp.]